MGVANNAKDLLVNLCSAFSAGDIDTIGELFSKDEQVVFIGSDPQEWLQGHSQIMGTLRMQLVEMGGSLNIRIADPTGLSGPVTGWAADRPVVAFPDGTRMRTRLSIFGRREEEDWKIVHLHFSIGVGNEEAIGQDLSVA